VSSQSLAGELWVFIRTRFLSFAMVGGVCFLLLASLTVETVLRGLSDYLKSVMPGGHVLALALFLIFDLAVIVLLFAMIFDAKRVCGAPKSKVGSCFQGFE
jgi:membrane protein